MTIQHQSLSTTLVSSESLDSVGGGSDFLRIEQVPWPEKPAGGFNEWAAENGMALTFDNYERYRAEYEVHCNEAGELPVTLLIHRSRFDLDYVLHTDNGEFGPTVTIDNEVSRSISLSKICKEYVFSEQVQRMISAGWDKDPLGAAGTIIVPPELKWDAGKNAIVWTVPAFGSIKTKYTRQVDQVVLTIAPREDTDDVREAYRTTVRAIWGENVTTHEVELPDNITACGGGGYTEGSAHSTGPENCRKRIVEIGLCSGEKKADYTEPRACPEAKTESEAETETS